MFRLLVLCLFGCGLTVGLIGFLTGGWVQHEHPGEKPVRPAPFAQVGQPAVDGGPLPRDPAVQAQGAGAAPPQVAGALPAGAPAPAVRLVQPNARAVSRHLIVPGGRLMVIEKQEVPAEAEGKVLFVGTEVRGKDLPPADLRITQTVAWPSLDKPFRLWEPGMPILPTEIRIHREPREYRRLAVGDSVRKGDLVALINPDFATDDLAAKIANFEYSEYDRIGTIKIRDEYLIRYNRNVTLGSAVPKEELDTSRLNYEKYAEDARAKVAMRTKAEQELRGSITHLRSHHIRANVSGVIKTIYKNSGDPARKLDPILQILNLDRMQVEGLIGVEYLPYVSRGMRVLADISRADPPGSVLVGNHLEVNAVAVGMVRVSGGSGMIVLSGGEDRTVRGWDPANGGKMLWEIGPFAAPVRSLACPPMQANSSTALVGVADGSVWLIDLTQPGQGPVDLAGANRHKGAVNTVAFSPDGQTCATSGEDRAIMLWNVAGRQLIHSISAAHRAAVTSLSFVDATQLISSGRDYSTFVWQVAAGKPPVRGMEFDRRSGEVPVTNTDGQHVLFDRGKELRLESIRDRSIQGTLKPAGSSPFARFALFSPDGKTILTTGTDNKTQLWRTPLTDGRVGEVRQFLWDHPVSCAAFAPDNSFVVTGTLDDRVLIWAMPTTAEVESRIEAQVVLIEPVLDSSSLQVRLWAELRTVPKWLVPGSQATLVVPLEKPVGFAIAP